jgi:hypothetical protein
VVPWSVAEQLVGAFATHEVLFGVFVDDTFANSPAGVGEAHYDVIMIDNRTLTDHSDTNENP